MRRKSVPETQYRGSRFCRILGNPTAYQIIRYLSKGTATPSELAEEIGLSLSTICCTLRTLRNIDVVRYEINDKSKVYFLKDETIAEIVKSIEKFVRHMRFLQ
ncbi:MAG: helix-turn-helix domain-containing protein [candidate division WOR-3 bacterium]